MKNLTEFKKFLKSIEGNPEKKVVLTREIRTFYDPSHPSYQSNPTDHYKKLEFSYISIVKTNAFAIKKSEGDLWCQFGSEKNWTFQDNTATYTGGEANEGYYSTISTLEYRFI